MQKREEEGKQSGPVNVDDEPDTLETSPAQSQEDTTSDQNSASDPTSSEAFPLSRSVARPSSNLSSSKSIRSSNSTKSKLNFGEARTPRGLLTPAASSIATSNRNLNKATNATSVDTGALGIIADDASNNNEGQRSGSPPPILRNNFNNLSSLTKKPKLPRVPKVQISGMVNYGIRHSSYSDSESENGSMIEEGGYQPGGSNEGDAFNDNCNGGDRDRSKSGKGVNDNNNDNASHTSIESDANAPRYSLPFALSNKNTSPSHGIGSFMKRRYNNQKKDTINSYGGSGAYQNMNNNDDERSQGPIDLDSVDDENDSYVDNLPDDASIRTPMPMAAPQQTLGAILPKDFLRDRSNSISNVSDLSDTTDEETSVTKRKKREDENVGRLVLAAKQQQSFAQAWFTAGQAMTNALPKYVKKGANNNQPNNTTTSKESAREGSANNGRPGTTSSGPIDLDSGKEWNNEDEDDSKVNMEVGSFNFTTHSGITQKRKGNKFIKFGVPDDEDLTTYYRGDPNCWDRIVCTINNTRCSLLALVVVSVGLIVLIIGSSVTAILLQKGASVKEGVTALSPAPSVSFAPSLSWVPTITPSDPPTSSPSLRPSRTPSHSPTAKPSTHPSRTPTLRPSSEPSISPTWRPSTSPSSFPTSQPSVSPTKSAQPSPSPSSAPSTFFSASFFDQIGSDLNVQDKGQIDQFGQSVSISKDGTVMAVGALFYPNDFGSISVYQRSGGGSSASWVNFGDSIRGQVAKGGAGHAVELSEDGLTLIMSEYNYDQTAIASAGIVRIFKFNANTNTWDQKGQQLEGSWPFGQFGYSVSINNSGDRVAIGAPNHNIGTGRILIYTFNENDLQWEQSGQPLPPSQSNLPPGSNFGTSVDLSEDGTSVACGAPTGVASGSIGLSGVAFVYKWNSKNEQWDQHGSDISFAPNTFAPLKFGQSLSLSGDGQRIAVGAPDNNFGSFFRSGTVSIFQYGNDEFDGKANDDTWHKIGDLGGTAMNQGFGYSVSLASSGRHVAVGSPLSAPLNALSQTGQVNVYRWNGSIWDPAASIDGTSVNGALGQDVDIQVDDMTNELSYVAVGSPGLPRTAKQGVARVYEWKR